MQLNKPNISLDSFVWYLKYFGIPLTFGAAMYGICCRRTEKKRKAALQGKVVVITGASSGIGEALAHLFYEYGSKVVLVSRRETELNRVKQDLIAKSLDTDTKEPVVLTLDLAELDQTDKFVEQVNAVCGHVDILINNGGVSHRDSVLNTSIEVDKKIMFINYFGAVALTKALLPQMVSRKSGNIVFVSSVQGLIAIPDRSAYAAAKHAMQAFADSLRAEMKQHNIHVAVMSPGYVQTAISLNALKGSGNHHGVMDKETASGFTAERVATEIIDMVVDKKIEVVCSQLLPKLAIFLRHCSASLYFQIMARRAKITTLENSVLSD